MRFYDLPQWLYVTAPPNVLIDNLASTGIVGSVAFFFLVWVTVKTMIRLPYALGTLGLGILIGHYVDGLFDIFWIGGPSGAPYIICGISLGMADRDRQERRPVPTSRWPRRPVAWRSGLRSERGHRLCPDALAEVRCPEVRSDRCRPT